MSNSNSWHVCTCDCHKSSGGTMHCIPCCSGKCTHCGKFIVGDLDAHIAEKHPEGVGLRVEFATVDETIRTMNHEGEGDPKVLSLDELFNRPAETDEGAEAVPSFTETPILDFSLEIGEGESMNAAAAKIMRRVAANEMVTYSELVLVRECVTHSAQCLEGLDPECYTQEKVIVVINETLSRKVVLDIPAPSSAA